VSPASKGPGAGKGGRPQASSSQGKGKGKTGGAAGGAGRAGAGDHSGVAAPKLPPFWVEWKRAVVQKWPVPVFVLAVLTGAVVFLARPRTEPARSAEERVQMARKAFAMAVSAQDEREDLGAAIDLLAGRNLKEVADALGIQDPYGVHGVLTSYERVQEPGSAIRLDAVDQAIRGEACFRLAEIKREHPEGIGRRILKPADALYRRALADLGEACGRVPGNAGPEWHRRRRLIAESRLRLGEYSAALTELESLIEAMTADQAGRLHGEKDPAGSAAGAGASVSAGSRQEWARVYELAGDCSDHLGRTAQAAASYRLLLGLGEAGGAVQRVRLRLAELIMDEALAGHREVCRDDKAGPEAREASRRRAMAGLDEACQLCAKVESSDAPAAMREQAGFMLGRGRFRLGELESDPARARAYYAAAAQALGHPFSAGGPYMEIGRVLGARSLFLAGSRGAAAEQLKTALRMGLEPALYACAEVCMADLLLQSDPARALDGDAGHGGGYMGAARHIRNLTAEGLTGFAKRAPELAELLSEAHFVVADPDPRKALPEGRGQLLRLARECAANRNFDEAVRICRQIVDCFPGVRTGRYRAMIGELLCAKAERASAAHRAAHGAGGQPAEAVQALAGAAAEFMRAFESMGGVDEAAEATDALWRAGQCYLAAGRYDGAALAFRMFSDRAGTDGRVAEALYRQGEALRMMGSREAAAKAFGLGAVSHPASQYGYLAQLALGETYLELDRLEAGPDEKGAEAGRNALAVFEAIRRDTRYTPESQVWMKALFRLGETHFRIGRRHLSLSSELRLSAGSERDAKASRELTERSAAEDKAGREHLRAAARVLEEACERYPLGGGSGRESFDAFLRERRLPVMRMLAMIQLDLGSYDQAAARFGEIVQAAAGSGEPEATRAAFRREAFTCKGVAELLGSRPDAAVGTFRAAHEDYGRTADGPWLALALAVALERSGRPEASREWYDRAAKGYADQAGAAQTAPAPAPGKGEARSFEAVLPAEIWREHAQWLGKRHGGS